LAVPEPAVGAQASKASDVAALLEVKGLSKAFGGFQALSEISLEVSAGGPLGFVGLGRVASRRVSALTSGEQKLLDLARALAARPEVLLVDELGAGLNPGELAHVAGLLRRLKDAGMALIVVEHLMGFLEQVVDTVTVLNAGMAIFRGDLRAAVADRRVVEVFLGEHQG
jgi:branched-chain amino acid transport system ATP-binding protein